MENNQIVKLNPEEYGITEIKAQEIQAIFAPMLEKMVELEKRYNLIVKKDISEDVCAEAKRLRLDYVKVRTGTADIHKKEKDFYLKGGRFVDGWKNAQAMASQGKEEKLKKLENYYEIIEQERISKLQEERTEKLHKYEPEMNVPNLGEMADDVWNNYIGGVKMQHDARIKAEKKAEKDRIKLEQAEIAEQIRIKKENAKLKAEAEERDRKAKIEADKRKEEEAKRLTRERIEREKREEEVRIEREKIETKLKAERRERERLQKIEDDRIIQEEAEYAAQREEKRKVAAAPDKEKLLKLAEDVENMDLPIVLSDEAGDIRETVRIDLVMVAQKIRESCEIL